MHTNTFAGIVVEDSELFGVRMERNGNDYIITDCQRMERSDDLVYDISEFSSTIGQGVDSGIVQVGQARHKILSVPDTLGHFDIRSALDRDDPKFTVADIDSWFHCFKVFPGEHHMEDILVVALPKKQVATLANGIIAGSSFLQLIDYWPNGLSYVHDIDVIPERIITDIVQTGDTIHGYVWEDDKLLFEDTKGAEETPIAFVHRLWHHAKSRKAWFTPISLYVEDAKDWEEAINTFGVVKPITHKFKDSKMAFKDDHPCWQVAAGLCYRWLQKGA